jgi:hypothetical protein
MYSFYSAGFVSHTRVELNVIAFEFDLRRSQYALIILDSRPVRNRLFYEKAPCSRHQRPKTIHILSQRLGLLQLHQDIRVC